MTRLNIPLFVALAASILSAVPVDGRDTLPHQRMIRKRGPSIGGPGPIGGAAAVIGLHVRQNEPTGSASVSATGAGSSTSSAAAASTTPSSTTAAATSSSPTSSAAASTPSSSSTAAASSTTSGGLLDSLTGILGSSTSSTISSTSTSTTPTTSSTPTSTSTSQAQAPQTSSTPVAQTPTLNLATSSPASATVRNPSVSVVAITSTQAAAAASSSAAAEKTRKITRNTIVSLVVVAACIGGAIAIWTVIRKWKLSPSEKFDDRMQPIDWAPPPANGVNEDAIEEKSKHRRVGSGASHGSFTSGGVGQSEQGHGAKGPMYADSQYGHGYGNQPQDFPPAHDFTAGTAQPGYGQYYGNQQYAAGPGYADLQRGPSMSESNYSHGADLQRGMSYSRGHAAYDSQSGPAPPLPNPYGGEYGYDDYNHHPQAAQQQPQAQAQGQAPYRAF